MSCLMDNQIQEDLISPVKPDSAFPAATAGSQPCDESSAVIAGYLREQIKEASAQFDITMHYVHEAVLAERERCARVANKYKSATAVVWASSLTSDSVRAEMDGRLKAANDIEAQIRVGESQGAEPRAAAGSPIVHDPATCWHSQNRNDTDPKVPIETMRRIVAADAEDKASL